MSHNSGLELAVTNAFMKTAPAAPPVTASAQRPVLPHWRTSDTCAGYLQLRARDKMDLSGLAPYVCLDFGHADGSCDVDLAEHDIPHAFLHLTLRAKALANKDGPFDTSDPFYTISRIDDAGSLAEEPVVVFVSTVRALVRVCEEMREERRGGSACSPIKNVVCVCVCVGVFVCM